MNQKVVEEVSRLEAAVDSHRGAKLLQGRVGSRQVSQRHRHLIDHHRLILVPHHRTTALQPPPMVGTSTSRPRHRVIKKQKIAFQTKN